MNVWLLFDATSPDSDSAIVTVNLAPMMGGALCSVMRIVEISTRAAGVE
jgi:hypothetical protein